MDVTNQYYSALHYHRGARIDYAKYLAESTKGLNLYRAFAFGAQMNEEASSFLTVLRSLGFETRYRKAAIFGDRPDIRRTDRNMPLAMEIWRVIEKLDIVVIGSNDPDLVPLVQRIKELGIQVIVYSCNISRDLKESADRCIEIDLSMLEHRLESSA